MFICTGISFRWTLMYSPFIVDKGRARRPMVISRKMYERVANLLYWKEDYAFIKSIPCLFKDITNTNNNCIFVCNVTVNFHRKKSFHDARIFAFATTSCRFFMCFIRQTLNRRKSNITSNSIVLKQSLLFLLTSSQSSSRPVAKWSNLPTFSSTKCAH